MQTKKSLVPKFGIACALAAVTTSSFAALPAGVATTVNDISGNVQSVFDLIFPVVMLSLGLVVVIKLFKKFVSKI